MILSDHSITIQPSCDGPSNDGKAVNYIGTNGIQKMLIIINQLLANFVSTIGLVSAADSILQAIQKLVSASNTSYADTVITAVGITLTPFQRSARVTATGQTMKFPLSTAPGVIPNTIYIFVFPPNLLSAGTVAVTTGDSLNGALNGTVAAPAGLGGPNIVRGMVLSGAGWWIC